jgi:hypothetical protein
MKQLSKPVAPEDMTLRVFCPAIDETIDINLGDLSVHQQQSPAVAAAVAANQQAQRAEEMAPRHHLLRLLGTVRAIDRIAFERLPGPLLLGHLYQRDRRLDPENNPDGAQPFHITIDDLIKPSLLVCAPGSGKTNLAMTLLMDLRDRDIPFLVLDPSTGQEFHEFLRHPKLNKDLVVYTVGDEGGVPLRFNPFSLPPGVRVRAHSTRLLAAVRAAIEMADPVPAVFEGALERIYTDRTYSNPPFSMSDKGDIRGDQHAPTFNDLNKAMLAELNERALPLYAGSAETTGKMRGASSMRVNAIARKLGFILNAKGNNGAFLGEMLRRPTVIEMGALGDSSSIALVRGFS